MGGQRKAWNLQGQKDTGPTYLRVPRSGRGKLLNKDGTVSYPRTNEYVPSQEIYLFHRAPFYLLSTMERGGAKSWAVPYLLTGRTRHAIPIMNSSEV